MKIRTLPVGELPNLAVNLVEKYDLLTEIATHFFRLLKCDEYFRVTKKFDYENSFTIHKCGGPSK